MPEFFYRASMNADVLKSMDPRIREDDDPVTQFMIHYILVGRLFDYESKNSMM